jgi:ATP-dependent Clp protease ATP-binding subunit ClpB
VDFKNAVVIMTSNVGSHFIADAAFKGDGMTESIHRQVMDTLRTQFRPEFLNRVDDIIVFHALSKPEMRQIIDIQLRGLVKRLEDRKIHVELSEPAKDLLIDEGYDPTYGARPLKRTIQRRVLDPLAVRVLQGDFREGDTVRIGVKAGALVFDKAEAGVAA